MIAPNSYLSKWSRWIALKLRHRAPNLKVVDFIDFEPGEVSADFLKRINCVFRKHNDTYAIFMNDLQSESMALTLKNPTNKINLEGLINNKDFLLVSNTEYLANRLKISYINNIKQFPIDDSYTSLNEKEYIDPEALETLELMTPLCSFKVSEKISTEEVTFFDAMLQRLEHVKFELQNVDNKTTFLNSEFTKSNQGACIIKINGKEFNRFYVTNKKQLNIAVEIFFNPPGKSKTIWDGKKFETQNMQISFDTKTTHWQYILISRSEEKNIYDINEVSFDMNGEKIQLWPLVRTELVNGVKCIHATFKELKPLRINTFNHEILKMKINNAKKWNQSSIRMPIPTFKNVQRIDRKSGMTYSLMYVYI